MGTCGRIALAGLCASLAGLAAGQSWQEAGTSGASGNGVGGGATLPTSSSEQCIALAVDSTGAPVIFWKGGTSSPEALYARKLSGGTWTAATATSDTTGIASYDSIDKIRAVKDGSGNVFFSFLGNSGSSTSFLGGSLSGSTAVGYGNSLSTGITASPYPGSPGSVVFALGLFDTGEPFIPYGGGFSTVNLVARRWNSAGSDWPAAGTNGLAPPAMGTTYPQSPVVASRQAGATPTIAYKVLSGGPAVYELQSGTWQALPGLGISETVTDYPGMCVMRDANDSPVVACVVAISATFFVRVLRYNGTTWDVLGTDIGGDNPAMVAGPCGEPLLASRTVGGGTVQVRRWNESLLSWEAVGTDGVAPGLGSSAFGNASTDNTVDLVYDSTTGTAYCAWLDTTSFLPRIFCKSVSLSASCDVADWSSY